MKTVDRSVTARILAREPGMEKQLRKSPTPKRSLRAAVWGVMAAGIAAPVARRKLRIRPLAVLGMTASAPVALSVLRKRTPLRDIAVCCLQCWAYLALYEMPGDEPEVLERRVHIDYPIKIDRMIGMGQIPSVRLQGALARDGKLGPKEKFFVWIYWLWFLFPHSSILFMLFRRREKFARAAAIMYGTFDIGACVYWLLPTAPPWYAAKAGRVSRKGEPALRRMMFEYGEQFWGERWAPMHGLLAGNPLAAMPSLHCATSIQAARLLSECGPVPAVIGWSYAIPLCFSLVYLGEHYVTDLVAGFALAEVIFRKGDVVKPVLTGFVKQVESVAAKVGSV